MARTVDAARTDLVDRKLRVAQLLLDKAMNDLDETLMFLAQRDEKGKLLPVKGARLADVRDWLFDIHGEGLLALAELGEARNLDAGVDPWIES